MLCWNALSYLNIIHCLKKKKKPIISLTSLISTVLCKIINRSKLIFKIKIKSVSQVNSQCKNDCFKFRRMLMETEMI